jgi:cell fate regulator YaaT (PSP1 superfamily)
MENIAEPVVVGVRFSKVGKVYHFSANSVTDLKVGDMVVVETSRGWQLGQVAQVVQDAKRPPEGWKELDRRATPRDLLLRQMWQMKESEVVSRCRERAGDINLVGIKIVSAEYSFDGSRLTILFSSETEEKYDLKSLRQDMQKMFAPSQVEMRQIGPRDVAKTVCGMGACGLETRCCCLFLTEFSSISIKMAKEQGISLTPTEITGMCGRLRCCLIYEYDTYVEARSKLPKRNKRVNTPLGEGKVVDIVPLRESVIVDLPETGRKEFPGSEVSLVEDGAPRPVQPFRGTQQPSEIDQAITGVKDEKEFTIPADTPPAPAENEPKTQQPADQPQRREQQQRGTRPGRDESVRGSPPGERSKPQQGRGGQGRQRQRPGGQGRKDRGPGAQSQGPQQGEKPGGQPTSGRPEGGRPEGGRPEGGQPTGGRPAGEEQPKPKGGPGSGSQAPRGGRDQRRRRGRRRDSSSGDTENRT